MVGIPRRTTPGRGFALLFIVALLLVPTRAQLFRGRLFNVDNSVVNVTSGVPGRRIVGFLPNKEVATMNLLPTDDDDDDETHVPTLVGRRLIEFLSVGSRRSQRNLKGQHHHPASRPPPRPAPRPRPRPAPRPTPRPQPRPVPRPQPRPAQRPRPAPRPRQNIREQSNKARAVQREQSNKQNAQREQKKKSEKAAKQREQKDKTAKQEQTKKAAKAAKATKKREQKEKKAKQEQTKKAAKVAKATKKREQKEKKVNREQTKKAAMAAKASKKREQKEKKLNREQTKKASNAAKATKRRERKEKKQINNNVGGKKKGTMNKGGKKKTGGKKKVGGKKGKRKRPKEKKHGGKEEIKKRRKEERSKRNQIVEEEGEGEPEEEVEDEPEEEEWEDEPEEEEWEDEPEEEEWEDEPEEEEWEDEPEEEEWEDEPEEEEWEDEPEEDEPEEDEPEEEWEDEAGEKQEAYGGYGEEIAKEEEEAKKCDPETVFCDDDKNEAETDKGGYGNEAEEHPVEEYPVQDYPVKEYPVREYQYSMGGGYDDGYGGPSTPPTFGGEPEPPMGGYGSMGEETDPMGGYGSMGEETDPMGGDGSMFGENNNPERGLPSSNHRIENIFRDDRRDDGKRGSPKNIIIQNFYRRMLRSIPYPASKETLASAKRYLYLSYASYCDASDIQTWGCKWCRRYQTTNIDVVGVARNRLSGTQAYVGYSGKTTVVVSFRGSGNVQNWIQNVVFPVKTLNWLGARRGAKVHTGFLTAYESIRKPVLQYLYVAREKCKNCKIVVTGHSLGGALTVLAALDFTLKGIKVSSVFTFGCPRVGDPVFAHWWDSRVAPGNAYRFVHRSDLVPHLPPSNMAVKKAFKHVGKELWQTRVVTWSCGYGEHTTCSYKIPFYEGVASDHVKYFGLSGVSLSNPCN